MKKTITALTVQAKNKNRSNLFLDGAFFCSLDNLIVVKYSLKAGIEIEQEKLQAIQEENEFSFAFDLALNYVSRFRKTKKQLIEYLLKKGYLYPLCCKVVDKLIGYGYVDDSDFARAFVEQNSKTKGKLLLKMQLQSKGVDKKCAEQAVENINETPQAIELAKKYMRNKEDTRENKAKCYRYILSKGFSYDSAHDAINALGGDTDDY